MHYPNRLLCPGGGRKERSPSDFTVRVRGEVGALRLCSGLGPLVGALIISLTCPGQYNPHFTKHNSETHRFNMKSNISAGEFGTHLFLTLFKGCPFHVPVVASNKREGLDR